MARPARHSLTAAERRRIEEIARGDSRIAFVSRYLRGMGLAGNGCRTVPFVGTGVDPEAYARILRHPDVLWLSPDFARPVRGTPLPDASAVPGAIGLSSGLARLLGKPKVHDEVDSSAWLPVPDCAGRTPRAQIAADANVQLAGMTFDGSLSAIDGEIVNHLPRGDRGDRGPDAC